MSRLSIKDLDFCNLESNSRETIGSGYAPNTWNWDAEFAFDFDSDGISNFSTGHVSSYAIAIGPIFKKSGSKRK